MVFTKKVHVVFLFATFCLIFLSLPQPALAEAKEICRNFAVEPKTFGKLKFIRHKQYKKKNVGVFIKYGIRNHFVSVFKYDSGQTRITDEYLQKRLASSIRAFENAVAKRQDKILSPAKQLVWKMGDTLFHGVAYRVSYKKYKLKAYEYVGLSHNTACMLKVRFTDALKTKASTSLVRYKSYVKRAHQLFE